MIAWSPEVRVLRDPAATFREVAASGAGAWTLLRRPLFLLFVMGLFVSLQSSGRLSVRAVPDGMISFLFLPVVEVLALGVVYLRGDRRLPFARIVDAFFVSNAPWFLWILGFFVWRIGQTPLQLSAPSAVEYWSTAASLIVPAVWSAWLDVQFFRVVLLRRAGSAVSDVLLQRLVGWPCALGYFFGIAAWGTLVEWIH